MDLHQFGESSTPPSPHIPKPNGTTHTDHPGVKPSDLKPTEQTKLMLPTWDVPGEKHLHPSLDLISLLHLDTLYDTFVRPYADAEEDELGSGEKVGKGKKRRLEKGYAGLIEDCIDPTPLGERRDHQSLLPLIGDMMNPPGPPPSVWGEALDVLPLEAFQAAKLEVGTKQDGYGGGEKTGVREAEERRRRKKARHSQSLAPDLSSPLLPSPTTEYPMDQLAPVAPPTRSYPMHPARRQSLAQGVRPFPGQGGRGARPAQSVPPRPQMGMGGGGSHKRPLEGAGGGQQKRVKMGSGSRSASPAAGNVGGMLPGGRPPQPGGRSRTEGI